VNRRGLLAMVHCARKDLALDEDTYRAVLEQVGGKSSARDLSDADLGRVVERFRAQGWAPKQAKPFSKKPAARMAWALWSQLGKRGELQVPDRSGMRAFCKNLVGVEEPDWMTPEQLSRVIENLKSWERRTRK